MREARYVSKARKTYRCRTCEMESIMDHGSAVPKNATQRILKQSLNSSRKAEPSKAQVALSRKGWYDVESEYSSATHYKHRNL